MRGALFLLWARGGSCFRPLRSLDLSRQVGWPSAGEASRRGDQSQVVGKRHRLLSYYSSNPVVHSSTRWLKGV